MTIKRWWAEVRNPALKCERLGHNIRRFIQRGLKPGGIMAVATEYKRITEECTRCKYVQSTEDVEKDSIQSLTLPGDRMDRLKEDGWLEQGPKELKR